MNGLFVTGTDTGTGKTRVAQALLRAYAKRGLRVAGMKPVASGADFLGNELVNEDALALQQECSETIPYALINPYVFQPPIAPHIAAQLAGVEICPDRLLSAYQALSGKNDVVIVEGAGGWRVPLGQDLTTADLVKLFNIQVILVVGLRLGCINHALLTAEVIQHDGVALAGWVASHIDPLYAEPEQTLTTLVRNIDAPLLGVLPYCTKIDVGHLAERLDVDQIAPDLAT
ncbi:MAG: dethiobiotin synthase [Gammaproteobacteria bacterium]|nr:dethiobiotin synthase [Gammaproteobacteria bacterium]